MVFEKCAQNVPKLNAKGVKTIQKTTMGLETKKPLFSSEKRLSRRSGS